MAVTIDARVQQKTDTEANWLANPLVLLNGECAFVLSADGTLPINFKIGDGTKPFSTLPYWINYASNIVIASTAPGGTLPSPATPGKIMVVAPGTYTQPTGGGTLTAAANTFTVLFWDGTVWAISISLPLIFDLTNYIQKSDLNILPSTQLFDKSTLLSGVITKSGYEQDKFVTAADGSITTGATGWRYAHMLIPVGATQIAVSGLQSITSKVYRFTNSSNVLISFGNIATVSQVITIPAGAVYFDCNFYRPTTDTLPGAQDTFMVNAGAVVLPYDNFTLGYVDKIKGYEIRPSKAFGLVPGNVTPDPITATSAVNKQTQDAALALKTNLTDTQLPLTNDLVQANLVNTPAAPKYTYTIDAGKNLVVTGITGGTAWDVQWTDQTSKLKLEFGSGRMWFAIGYTDATHIAVLGCAQQTNLFGNVVNVDLTANTFVTKETHGLVSMVAGETCTVEIVGDAINLYKNDILTLTYSKAALVALGVSLTNIKLGVALFNSGGTTVTNGSTAVKNMKYFTTQNLKDYTLGLGSVNNIKGKNFSFLCDSIGTTTYGGNTESTLFHGLLVSKFGINKYVNAISGTAIGGTATDRGSAVARWGILGTTYGNSNVDGVVIEMGTNDFRAREVDLGTPSDPNTSPTLYGSLKALYEGLQGLYQNAKIFHITPLHRHDTTINAGFPESATRTVGGAIVYLSDYVKAIEDMAKLYGVIIIPGYNESGLTYPNMITAGTYSPEGLHLYPAGQYKLFEVSARYINSSYKS